MKVSLLLALAAAGFALGAAVSFGADHQTGKEWQVTARSLRGQLGVRASFPCPPGGTAYPIWGTDIYTDDSSVCTAAVHAGFITLTRGGTITIEMRSGLPRYEASTRNGIASQPWHDWYSSFSVVSATQTPTTTTSTRTTTTARPWPIVGTTWNATAKTLRGQIGQKFVFRCPPGGRAYPVWGTDVYTDDSSVCTAAVHDLALTFRRGGTVRIEVLPGQTSYRGTTRHGVRTRSWGSWGGSFRFK